MPLPLLPLAGIALAATPAGALLISRHRSRVAASAADTAAREQASQEEQTRYRRRVVLQHLVAQIEPLGTHRMAAIDGPLQRFMVLQSMISGLDPADESLRLSPASGPSITAPDAALWSRLSAVRQQRSPAAMALWGLEEPPGIAVELGAWMRGAGEPPAAVDWPLALDERMFVARIRALTAQIEAMTSMLVRLLPRAGTAQEKLSVLLHVNRDYRSLPTVPLPGDVISPRALVGLNFRYAAALSALSRQPVLSSQGEILPTPASMENALRSALRMDGWQQTAVH